MTLNLDLVTFLFLPVDQVQSAMLLGVNAQVAIGAFQELVLHDSLEEYYSIHACELIFQFKNEHLMPGFIGEPGSARRT